MEGYEDREERQENERREVGGKPEGKGPKEKGRGRGEYMSSYFCSVSTLVSAV